MCRSAEDCALVLHEIAGGDSEDQGSAGRGFAYTPRIQRKPGEITIGYAPADFQGWEDAGARATFSAALEAIKAQGYHLKEVKLPDFPYGALLQAILAGEAGSIFEEFIRSGQVDQLADPQQIAGLKSYLDVPATDYLRAMRVRTLVQAAFHDLMLDVQVLLSPSRYEIAPRVTDPLDRRGPGPIPPAGGFSSIIPAANLAGLPALSLPCGFVEGLPVAISLVGRAFYENQLIGIGNAFQKQTDWHRRRPPS
jgi:aspartyl-tRNA(Asn)/glutamyl-tRNA(Gln) amidotransferase subunit A